MGKLDRYAVNGQGQPITRADRYHWHEQIARELRRLRDECGSDGYNIKGIASNIDSPTMDVERWAGQMVAWGEVEECAPMWDNAPESFIWVRLT